MQLIEINVIGLQALQARVHCFVELFFCLLGAGPVFAQPCHGRAAGCFRGEDDLVAVAVFFEPSPDDAFR